MNQAEINVIEITARAQKRRRRIDPDKLLRYRAKSGRKVVVGRLLPHSDVAVTHGTAA